MQVGQGLKSKFGSSEAIRDYSCSYDRESSDATALPKAVNSPVEFFPPISDSHQRIC